MLGEGKEEIKLAGLFKRLFGAGSGGERDDPNILSIYAKCDRCGEKLRVRVNKSNDLSSTYEDAGPAYTLIKTIVGSNCPNRMEANFTFDGGRRPLSQEISGGELISKEDFEDNSDQ